jgi:hypothetical protein
MASQDVRQHTEDVYPRAEGARECSIGAALLLPVYLKAGGATPMAVLEVVQLEASGAVVVEECLRECLQVSFLSALAFCHLLVDAMPAGGEDLKHLWQWSPETAVLTPRGHCGRLGCLPFRMNACCEMTHNICQTTG